MTPDPYTAVAALIDRGSVLLATDFDGVLAPLVLDPMTSRPVPGAVDALVELAGDRRVHVAVVSGRDLGTLAGLTGLPLDGPVALIGSHGGEIGGARHRQPLTPVQADLLRSLHAELAAVAEAHPGSRLEAKPLAVALHTRGLPEATAAAAAAAAQEVGRRQGVTTKHGKCVVELAVSAADKGSAVVGLAEAVGAEAIAYVGDDITDEDVFDRLSPGDVGIRVGPGPSAATHRLPDEDAVAELLVRLVAHVRGR